MQKMRLHVERKEGSEMECPEDYAYYKPDYSPPRRMVLLG